VVAKFLSAHKQRAQRIIKSFSAFFATEVTAAVALSGGESWEDTQSRLLNDVRLFHQDFVLGMIEASRGVSSVCKDLANSGSRPAASASSSFSAGEDHSSVAVQAYDDLYAAIAVSLPDYTEALIRALSAFFHSYEEAVRSGGDAEAGGSPIARAAASVAAGGEGGSGAPEGPSAREAQRQRWISFARQVCTVGRRHSSLCIVCVGIANACVCVCACSCACVSCRLSRTACTSTRR
jgi:hypothetical protein